jgi:hypothetical protein
MDLYTCWPLQLILKLSLSNLNLVYSVTLLICLDIEELGIWIAEITTELIIYLLERSEQQII